ncbi:hypothetical protein HPDFL43_16781 [Hoeflea phototrophica DFL-43]|uniref:GlsB/YeaQ/YmgE family stress response membrane protein n=1 Tax=Hoeflea phototrophica (strain DSM 17068 / NCIMB 14078 / DFL-43) TaxID=411684 RepID=A9D7V2_HOEPD|nr:hypothetical protein [Hoeflea phototrophica]EDQ33150.1 hypothetical protein HPDFL43_16781 [Hoeflea phototrophica DFL-43]
MFAGLASDEIWIFFALSSAAAFFVGNAMNTLLGEQGFGVLGNMLVLLAGFAVGLQVVDYLPIGRIPQIMVIPAAAAGAFALLFCLAVIKRLTRPT